MAKTGRKPKYSEPELMLRKGFDFFKECDDTGQPYTITGLAMALGFEDRHALQNYSLKPEFSPVIKKLRTRVENYVEKRAISANSIGAIFVLKNYGWSDKLDLEHSGAVTVKRVVSDI